MRTAEIIAFPRPDREPDTWAAQSDPEIARLDTSLEVVGNLFLGALIGAALFMLWGF